MKLTEQNYHSAEANRKYMSASQFKAFQDCEARAMAELNGEYVRDESESMQVGSYIDHFFTGGPGEYAPKKGSIYTQKGELRKEFQHANYVIERIQQDDLFMKYLSGQHQVIMTGKIEGVPFKTKMDSFHPGTAIVDLKVMKDMKPMYVPEQGRMTFIEAWRYDLQGAIYQAIEGHSLPFIIAAATKEKEPDIALISVPQPFLDSALTIVRNEAPRFQAIKQGRIEPMRCEKCDWCRRTKKLRKVITLDEFAEQDIKNTNDYDQ